MDRLLQYHRGYLDNMLKELENTGVNVLEYLNGATADIIINKKKYKIFQVSDPAELKSKIREFEKERLRENIIAKYQEEGIEISKASGGWKTIKREIDEEVNNICNYVIQKYSMLKTIENKGFIDIVYDGKEYKPAPGKVGRPTEKTKEYRINARLTEKQYKNLEKYAAKKNLKLSEALRHLLDRI